MAQPKLTLINGTNAPATVKESVRQSLRKTRSKHIPQCPSCQSRTYIEIKTATLKQICCAMCFMDKRMVVME